MGHDAAEAARLAELFNAAAFDRGGWMTALDALGSATRSGGIELIGLGGPAIMPFNITPLPPQGHDELLSFNGYAPTMNYRVAAADRVGVMQVAWEKHYDAVRPTLRSGDFDDFVRKWRIPHGCQMTLVRDSEILIGLALLRSEQDGPTSSDERDLFAEVAPHVRAATRTQAALGWQGARWMVDGLDATETAAFVCDASGVVQAMTSRADRLVTNGRVLTLAAKRLQACSPGDDGRLKAALARSLRMTPGEAAPIHEQLLMGQPGEQMVVQIDSLPVRDWSFAFAPRVLVVVRSASVRAASVGVLRAAFGLTPSEAEIAMLLAAGQSREAIAQTRGASLGTVRQQVKAILQKAHVSREAELIVAISRLG